MDKKYQVFISSTFCDLIEARERVRDVILSMLQFPVGMENFSAADEEQWEIIKETIDNSDYYVLIVGQRYGSVIENGDGSVISYTEKEFRYAQEKSIPILAFLMNDDVPIKKEFIEGDYKQELEAFKSKVTDNRVVEWWKTTDELAQKVSVALYKQINRKKRPGWVRADVFNLEESHAEIVALSKRVRELEEENSNLRAQVAFRKPQLHVSLAIDVAVDDDGNDVPLDYIREGNDGKLKLIIPEFAIKEEVKNKYAPLDISNIPSGLRGIVTEKSIENYNRELPSREEVDLYLTHLQTFANKSMGSSPILCLVENSGNQKATDVCIDMIFPKEIMVMDYAGICSDEPKELPIPRNPIKEGYKKLEKQRYHSLDLTDILMKNRMPTEIDITEYISNANRMAPIALGNSMGIVDNTLHIECKKGILHTREETVSGCYLLGTKSGVYEVKCSIMCAEYLEAVEQIIEIEVEAR